MTRAHTLSTPTNVTEETWQAASMLFERIPSRQLRLRLLGVGVSNLSQGTLTQLDLFADPEHERQSRLDEVTDDIKAKFGSSSLQRASGILHHIDPKSGRDGPSRDQYGE